MGGKRGVVKYFVSRCTQNQLGELPNQISGSATALCEIVTIVVWTYIWKLLNI